MATRKKSSSNNGRNVQEQAKNQKEQLAEQLSERASELADRAEYLAQHAQEMAMHADQRFRKTVDRRPMTAVWTSFGLGLGLGLAVVVLASSRRDDEWSVGGWSMDDLSDSLSDLRHRVESQGRSAAHRASDYAHDFGRSASKRVRDVAGSMGL